MLPTDPGTKLASPPPLPRDHDGDEQTARNVRSIAEIERTARDNVSFAERIARRVAAFCGSVTFVWLHVVWFGGWMLANSHWLPDPPDPFPYTFLTLIVSLEAIFLSAFILISQNQEARVADRRNQLDLQINLLAEQEATKTLCLLEKICTRLDIPVHDPELAELKRASEPEAMLELIDRNMDERESDPPPADAPQDA
ncbi:MAG: DUF1003 domain-containing protein [Gammaproteobacteria bacterium]|nr:DUF1003 domain-containing protein [Gammaproteobacteria bacterium]MBI5616756.1 DUF1003 domain-containing protein [Gammaproteobacteria bacterium]